MDESSVWVAIQYNIDDNYVAGTIGAYSTKNKAIAKIMSIIKSDFNEMQHEGEEIISLGQEINSLDELKAQLMNLGKCECLYGYAVDKTVIDQ
jgi:hypothetical protein